MAANRVKVLLSRNGVVLQFLYYFLVSGVFGVEVSVGILIEQVAILRVFLDDFEGHFVVGVLELDGEIGEKFIFVLANVYLLSVLPKLLRHPVRDV